MSARAVNKVSLVLLDLDGTVADTAPDLAAAINRQRAERCLEPLPLAALRPFASHGARGLIGRAFDCRPDNPEFETLRLEFLRYYSEDLCVHTQLFPQIEETLSALESRDIRWGIVTNKAARFTDPLIAALGLTERAACIVSGDTTAYSKPHPEPLLEALRRCQANAENALYVGDDLRDIQAGKAAGMRTVAAAWGYLLEPADLASWDAEFTINSPIDVLTLVNSSAPARA